MDVSMWMGWCMRVGLCACGYVGGVGGFCWLCSFGVKCVYVVMRVGSCACGYLGALVRMWAYDRVYARMWEVWAVLVASVGYVSMWVALRFRWKGDIDRYVGLLVCICVCGCIGAYMCLWVYWCVYVYVGVYVCICVGVCVGVYVCMWVCWCVYVYVGVLVRICVCGCIGAYMCMWVYWCVYVFVYVGLLGCVYVYVGVLVCWCLYVYVGVCVCVYVCVCVCGCVGVCVYVVYWLAGSALVNACASA